MKRYTRSVSEIWANWKDAAKLEVYPFDHTAYEDHEQVLTSLRSLDREEWAKDIAEQRSRSSRPL
jgi:hypothetical protein